MSIFSSSSLTISLRWKIHLKAQWNEGNSRGVVSHKTLHSSVRTQESASLATLHHNWLHVKQNRKNTMLIRSGMSDSHKMNNKRLEDHKSMEIQENQTSWDLGSFICIQMTLRAAIELNVFNIIGKLGPGVHLSSEEIISQIPTTNPSAAVENLERILKLLSVTSLLSTSLRPNANDNTVQEITYGLTKKSLCLVPNEDGVSLAPIIMYGSEMHFVQSLYFLKHTVLEPECSPFYKAHGETLYEYMSHKPELIQLFDKVMGIFSYLYFDQKVLEVYKGFEDVKELMDVGGGDGSSIAKIVSEYPQIHGINFNLPSVIARAPKYQGVKHVSGNMFESIPKTQSIMLKWVLHNWDDDHCKKILKNCWEALPETGKVIVVEHFVMPQVLEITPETMRIVTCDIFMMASCSGGKERTIVEFDKLAKSVGFIEIKSFPIFHGNYVIEFHKKKHCMIN